VFDFFFLVFYSIYFIQEQMDLILKMAWYDILCVHFIIVIYNDNIKTIKWD
jgi:hypothetical protein